jgi:hypothetical protein
MKKLLLNALGKYHRSTCPDCGKKEHLVNTNFFMDVAHISKRVAQGKRTHPSIVRWSTFRCACFLKSTNPQLYEWIVKFD